MLLLSLLIVFYFFIFYLFFIFLNFKMKMMSCAWKQALGWREKLSEKGSVKQTMGSFFFWKNPSLLKYTGKYKPH